MGVGERFDLVIDFSRYRPGDRVTLLNRLGGTTTARILQFTVARPARDDSRIPDRLGDPEVLDPADAAVTRDFVFRSDGGDMWTIDGKPFDHDRADATVRLGDTEIWRFTTDFHHPIHLHVAHFQVLSRNGHRPGPYDAGWKDTVDLDPAGQVSVIARFTDYPGRFVYHCHNLEHEDMAMMATLETVTA